MARNRASTMPPWFKRMGLYTIYVIIAFYAWHNMYLFIPRSWAGFFRPEPSEARPLTGIGIIDDGLPDGWTEHVDKKTGQTFYYHVDTKKSQWEHPIHHRIAGQVNSMIAGDDNPAGTRAQFATCAMLDGKTLFALGGRVAAPVGAPRYDLGQILASVVMFDRPNDRWEITPPMIHPRANFACGVIAKLPHNAAMETRALLVGDEEADPGYLFAVGGRDPDGGTGYSSTTARPGAKNLRSVERYDPAVFAGGTWGGWESVADMRVGRSGHAVAVLEGVLYVAGGYTTNSVESYDPARDRWNDVAGMNEIRANFAMGVLGHHMYAIAGWSNDKKFLTSIEVYNGRRKASGWTFLADGLPTHITPARTWFGGVGIVRNSELFLVGGFTDKHVGVGAVSRFTKTDAASGAGEWVPVKFLQNTLFQQIECAVHSYGMAGILILA